MKNPLTLQSWTRATPICRRGRGSVGADPVRRIRLPPEPDPAVPRPSMGASGPRPNTPVRELRPCLPPHDRSVPRPASPRRCSPCPSLPRLSGGARLPQHREPPPYGGPRPRHRSADPDRDRQPHHRRRLIVRGVGGLGGMGIVQFLLLVGTNAGGTNTGLDDHLHVAHGGMRLAGTSKPRLLACAADSAAPAMPRWTPRQPDEDPQRRGGHPSFAALVAAVLGHPPTRGITAGEARPNAANPGAATRRCASRTWSARRLEPCPRRSCPE